MEELSVLLNNISDSYMDFTTAILHYAGKDSNNLNDLIKYLKGNPGVNSSDVIKFVSDRKDFFNKSVRTIA